jgi:hypothetical protein
LRRGGEEERRRGGVERGGEAELREEEFCG